MGGLQHIWTSQKSKTEFIRAKNENRNNVEWFKFIGGIFFGKDSFVHGKLSVSKNNIGYFISVHLDTWKWRFKCRLLVFLHKTSMKLWDEERGLDIHFDDIKSIVIQKQWKKYPNVIPIYEQENGLCKT